MQRGIRRGIDRRKLLLVLAGSAVAAVGCTAADQSERATMQDGRRNVLGGMVGTWTNDGGSACRWWFEDKDGKRLGDVRTGRTVTFTDWQVEHSRKFVSDKCAPWRKR